jgi:hypothetical protein
MTCRSRRQGRERPITEMAAGHVRGKLAITVD